MNLSNYQGGNGNGPVLETISPPSQQIWYIDQVNWADNGGVNQRLEIRVAIRRKNTSAQKNKGKAMSAGSYNGGSARDENGVYVDGETEAHLYFNEEFDNNSADVDYNMMVRRIK